MKWRGYCDGYTDTTTSEFSSSDPTNAQLIHTKKAPLLLMEPMVTTNRFHTLEQRDYFVEWTDLSVTFLSGGLGQSRLWTDTMPQVTLQEPSLRFGAMAVGALRKAFAEQGTSEALTTDNRHYLNALVYYCEALKMQSKTRPTREGLRTALMASLLFICFETQRGNMSASLKHITHGFSLLNELAAGTMNAPDLVRMAQAPPAMVQELLDCFRPLELQSRSFVGSYNKVFFPTGNPPAILPASSAADLANASRLSSLSRQTSTQPDSPGSDAGRSEFSSPTGLPSPQSEDSPPSLSGTLPYRASPARETAEEQEQAKKARERQAKAKAAKAKTKDPRMAGLMPFKPHSPYFRPKVIKIAKLDEMPHMFTSNDEAHGYWTLIQRQMVQYIPYLTAVTAQLGLPHLVSKAEIEKKLLSVKKNAKIDRFIADSRYWLQRWIEAFEPLFKHRARNAHEEKEAYLGAINLRIEYLLLYIYTCIPRFSGLITAKSLTPRYREIVVWAETLVAARPSCGFAMDSGWTWPIFVTSFGCRDPRVREDAIRVLGQYPIRNALSDSRVFRALALKNREVEEACSLYGDENEQWLQICRRELVFEDFGQHIIFRSPVRDEVTGEWRLREEVADFTVYEDGLLRWRERPISDSMSILAGVC